MSIFPKNEKELVEMKNFIIALVLLSSAEAVKIFDEYDLASDIQPEFS